MKINRRAATKIVLAIMLIGGLAVSAQTGTQRWEKEIEAFEAADKAQPPPKGANLFVGSSSIRKWTTLINDFPGYKIINRGFGGSELADSVQYFDRLVTPCHPKKIFLFAGSNDLNAGKTPEQVFEDFKAFVAKAHGALPGTPVAYISISSSPSRIRDIEKVKTANALISAYIATDDLLSFINVLPAMLGPDGKPKPEIFGADRLHMNPRGYVIWMDLIGPQLVK